MEIKLVQLPQEKRKLKPVDDSQLGFGRIFTDHMFTMRYEPSKGWHEPKIGPVEDIVLHPAAMVLHYGQEVFEGLKAYHGAEHGIYLFRQRDNIARFNRSCKRMVMPEVDPQIFDRAIKKLVLVERDWIPEAEGSSLYIRPTIIATDPFLGVRPSNDYLFFIIVGPVGAYYPEGFNPVSIFVSDRYVRAVSGGVGEAKTSGNYAASLAGQIEAQELGFSQVLWLDAIERRYVEEVGTMNIFFVIDDEVITPSLTGSILPGVTRESVLTLGKEWGLKMVERMISINEVVDAQKSGRLKEVFGTGTAAIISPVRDFRYKEDDFQVADAKTGPIAQRFYDMLLAYQYGRESDPYGWVERIDK
ncbi:MAG: branched-chain amino acid aminotransferase [Candidatus Alcyoniella australis]|nr:branched-chain amino acid aminotransferase [Candidatus Alcyoniella australis]